MSLNGLNIDKSWTLFLDRDGVINKRIINGYVMTPDEFVFLPGVLEALRALSSIFGKIFVVTNQQGVGKGLIKEETLENIHKKMLQDIIDHGGRIDKVYYSPYREEERSFYRKPAIGMGIQARKEHPEILFEKALMLGDSMNDMQFGRRLGMKTVFTCPDKNISQKFQKLVDFYVRDLLTLSKFLM
jgi:histidinol-phosphate phosphatase family protein